MKTKPEIPIFVLALAALVGIVILLLMGKPIPAGLWAIALGLITGGLGITIPGAVAAPVAAEAPVVPVLPTVAAPAPATAPVAPLAAVATPVVPA